MRGPGGRGSSVLKAAKSLFLKDLPLTGRREKTFPTAVYERAGRDVRGLTNNWPQMNAIKRGRIVTKRSSKPELTDN